MQPWPDDAVLIAWAAQAGLDLTAEQARTLYGHADAIRAGLGAPDALAEPATTFSADQDG